MHSRSLASMLFLLALVLTGAVSAFSETPSPVATIHVVPFEYDEVTPNPVVKVRINGGAPLLFIVDTGTAAALVIQPWVRDQLGLKPVTGADAGDSSVEADAIDSFALAGRDGDVQFDVSRAYVVDLGILDSVYGAHKIAGLIGVQLFATTAAEFDFDAKSLTVYENANSFSIPGAKVAPVTMSADGVATVHVTVGPGKSTDLPIDTGGMFTGIPTTLTSSLTAKAVITRHWSGQIGGMYLCPDFLLPSLDIGGVKIPDVVVETLPETARCTLGLNVLIRYKFILDIPHNELILMPRTGVDLSPSLSSRKGATGVPHYWGGGAGVAIGYGRGWSGVRFDPGSTAWRVKALDAGSPARTAGVRIGDEITAIDGYSLAGLPNADVFHLLDGDAGAPASLTIRRDGKTLTVRFKRGDEFLAPRLPFDGLMIFKPDGGAMSVTGVQKGCPADRAGVRPGDTITRIDGQPTDSMSVDQMHQAAVDLSVHLEVTHSGGSAPRQVNLKSIAAVVDK